MNATIENEAKLAEAARDYLSLQKREKHPDGQFDKQGRWYPSEEEWQECCSQVRSPSRGYPYSLMTHCRSAEHVARRHGVEASALRAAARTANPPAREGGENYYKVVLVDGGRLVSIHEKMSGDVSTEYQLGVTLRQRARREHNGGYYVYPSVQDALVYLDGFSAQAGAEAVVLRCRVGGAYCRYGEKLAFSELTPVGVSRRLVHGAGGWETV